MQMPPEDDIYKKFSHDSEDAQDPWPKLSHTSAPNCSEVPLLIQYNFELHCQGGPKWLQFKIILIQQVTLRAIVRKPCKNNGCSVTQTKNHV